MDKKVKKEVEKTNKPVNESRKGSEKKSVWEKHNPKPCSPKSLNDPFGSLGGGW